MAKGDKGSRGEGVKIRVVKGWRGQGVNARGVKW